jgi:hypothetical protein
MGVWFVLAVTHYDPARMVWACCTARQITEHDGEEARG